MNSRMLPVRSAMSRSTGMVSLWPLLRFSRALGRQVFPVEGSAGRPVQEEDCSARGPECRAAGDRARGRQPEALAAFSFLSLAPICSPTPPQGTEKVKETQRSRRSLKRGKLQPAERWYLPKHIWKDFFLIWTIKKIFICLHRFICSKQDLVS